MEQQMSIEISPTIKNGLNISYIKNIILIDKTIKTPEIFFSYNNNETLPIYYNYYTDRDKLFGYLEKEFINIDRIAFIFDNSMMNNKYFLNNELFFTENDIINFQNNNECLENYSSNVNFLIKMCKKFNIKNIDFLACNSLQHNDWKIYYELLKHFSTTVIGASNNLTGNIKYGGDWVMENTNEDIQNIYFNENITNYSSTLFSSSISYFNITFSGRTGFLFILETTNNFSNLVLTNFTNLKFENNASDLQKIYKVYYRQQNVGTFVLASNVNNLNINLLPNKKYEIILIFTNHDQSGNGYYVYENTTIPITSVLSSTNELKMYPSNASHFIISTFNPNDVATYNSLKNGYVRNQALTLNYTFQLTPNISNFYPSGIIQTRQPNDPPFNFILTDPSSNSNGSFSYRSSIPSVANVSGNIVTVYKDGSSNITALQAATTNYTSGSISTTLLVSNICFPAGTLITTDQGIITIEKINPDIHTIHGKKIVGITQTISSHNFLICFEKHALGNNMPSQKTSMTHGHEVFYNGKMRKAIDFMEISENVYKVKYRGEVLYNVLIEKHETMEVNNLICETLNPINPIAKLYRILKDYSPEEQKRIAKEYNEYTIKNNNFNKTQLKHLNKCL